MRKFPVNFFLLKIEQFVKNLLLTFLMLAMERKDLMNF